MFPYIKQYTIPDMQEIIRNSKLAPLRTNVRLEGRLCVITGATSGVGLAAVKRFCEYGADILMINRNIEKSRTLATTLEAETGLKVQYMISDFSSLSQTADLAKRILDMDRPIDILINNAGIYMTTRTMSHDGIEQVFAVNHLASFLLTSMLLPKIVMNPGAKIIQVNSQGHRFGGLNINDYNWHKRPYMGLRAYGAAKIAQLLCTWEFAEQIKGSGVSINAMHPGQVTSSVGLNNGSLYRWYNKTFIAPTLQDAEISGIALHYLTAAPELANTSGLYFNVTYPEKPGPHALDKSLGRQVFDLSSELVSSYIGNI
jgi:retinol dehydrogenase-13